MGSEPYTDKDLAEIARAIGLASLPGDCKNMLVEAADSYLSCAKPADEWRSRSERRKQFKKIGIIARKLESELRNLDYSSVKLLDAEIGADAVGLLAEFADEALRKIPTKGGEPKKARLQLVGDLANIFEKVTGQRATRRVHDTEYGPFCDFVVASLRPIDPHAVSGVDTDIRALASKRKKKPSST